MKTLTILLSVLLSGFSFGQQTAPDGTEWQSPEALSLNKELPHAWFFSFEDIESIFSFPCTFGFEPLQKGRSGQVRGGLLSESNFVSSSSDFT